MTRRFSPRAAWCMAFAALAATASGCARERLLALDALIEVTDAIDFGDVAIGTSRSEALIVANTGTKDLTITDVRVVGADAFTISTDNQTTVEPEAQVIWEVTFSPTVEQALEGDIFIQSNALGAEFVEIHLTGLGVRGCDDPDGDGYGVNCPLGEDCDETDDTINDGTIWYHDFDEDTFGDPDDTLIQCEQPVEYVANDADCDDNNPTILDGVDWYLDGDEDTYGDPNVVLRKCDQPVGYVDNADDCDDGDETLALSDTYYQDFDSDTFGNPDVSVDACGQPVGYVTNADDCDDTDPDFNPDAVWYRDFDGDGYGDPAESEIACEPPLNYVANGDDCDDNNILWHPGATWYRDFDEDSYGDPAVSVDTCSPPPGYVGNDADCDDTDATRRPGATWYQDFDGDTFGNPLVTVTACAPPPGYVDNGGDCDDTDENVIPDTYWYRDFDGDTYGDPNNSELSCTQPSGYVDNDLDCDDNDILEHPGAVWYRDFDGDGLGNPDIETIACEQPTGFVANADDCDDDNDTIGAESIWYRDFDDDSYGNAATTSIACVQPFGYVDNDLDCDDTDDTILGAPLWYEDSDSDGYGNPDSFQNACTQPVGWVADDQDCDDTNPIEFPGAIWWRDFDDDSFGDTNDSVVACEQPTGSVANDIDCDDTDDTIGPNVVWYRDFDGDTYGDPNVTQQGCAQPAGYVDNDLDCDDTNEFVNPDADESGETLCNDGLDNDCDGEPDSFDSECTYVDCGDPAYYLTTDSCNSDYPYGGGPMICEEYPHSPWPPPGQEQCMQVCRTRDECPLNMACYPSRRSLNSHFCAPVLGANLIDEGDACTLDEDCVTALCHEGFCRDVCVRAIDCEAGQVCRAGIRTHAYIGNEIATGVCALYDPLRQGLGTTCMAASDCQYGVCAQSSTSGPYLCRQPCGSQNDCPGTERCSPSIYNNNPSIGYGFKACSEAPAGWFVSVGQVCGDQGIGFADAYCRSFFCDSTYCLNPWGITAADCLLPPYCTGQCDQDDDCPLLYPGYDNLQMKCMITSSSVIQPLIGGYCVPYWCQIDADCPSNSCIIFNAAGEYGMAAGICE